MKMAKKNIFAPGILFTIPDPQPTTVVGGGTGQSTTDPYACSFGDWMNLFASDVNEDGQTNFADYKIWFQNLFRGNEEEGEDLWDTLFGDGTPLYP
jgi:hypothetical protein